jgi:hypothetical protein
MRVTSSQQTTWRVASGTLQFFDRAAKFRISRATKLPLDLGEGLKYCSMEKRPENVGVGVSGMPTLFLQSLRTAKIRGLLPNVLAALNSGELDPIDLARLKNVEVLSRRQSLCLTTGNLDSSLSRISSWKRAPENLDKSKIVIGYPEGSGGLLSTAALSASFGGVFGVFRGCGPGAIEAFTGRFMMDFREGRVRVDGFGQSDLPELLGHIIHLQQTLQDCVESGANDNAPTTN